MDIVSLDICGMRSMLDKREISAAELAEIYLDRIEKLDGRINSCITVTADKARADAAKAQKKIDSGEAGALCGIPMAVKDNICTENIRTTCASKMLEDFIPPYNATVTERLESENIVLLGKTSLDEFAMGASTQTSAFKKTKNPYDISKVPGGSSGGSAAAVSAGLCAAALGSDTGGSVRQPAAFCGVTGLAPTYGRVSRYGLVAFASSLDQIGPIANSAKECGMILNAISGYDPHDGTSSKRSPEDFTSKAGMNIKGLKIALPREFFGDEIDAEVRDSVMKAADEYKSMGAELVDCSLPSLRYAVAAYYLISSAEAASNLARYDGIRFGHRSKIGGTYEELVINSRNEGFGDEVKRRIILGNYALSSGYRDEYYKKAAALRQKIRGEYADIFEKADIILTPTAPTTAYSADEIIPPAKMYCADICTVSVNIASLPAISTVCGYDENGLPIGMSLIGRMWDEALIIGAADAFERGFARTKPKI